MNPKAFLNSLFEAAVASVQAEKCLPPYLPPPPPGRTVVFGAGKASAAMGQTVERHWSGKLEGLIVTRYGHTVPCQQLEIVEAGHPVPDKNGMRAASEMLKIASGLNRQDLVLCLISGGGSSLLSLPARGLSLEDKQKITTALLKSGATIHEMNCVRKHLSAIKGGRLAAECAPATVLTLAISDVPGDDLSVIASGPTVPDATTFAESLNVLKKYNISKPLSVLKHLETAADETPKPADSRLKNVQNQLIATPQQALETAAQIVRNSGMTPLILGDSLEGEAREVAKVHAGIARQIQKYGQPAKAPAVLLSGGETSVTVRGAGRGGRNSEFLLSLLSELRGQPGIWAIACDTDGIDGTEDNAGAVIAPESFRKARVLGLNPADFLADNDAYSFFAALEDLLFPGATLTNVNDFRAVLILPTDFT